MRSEAGFLLAVAWFFASQALAQGKVFLTVDEALKLAFPGCEVERGTAHLSKAERATIAERAKIDSFDRGIVFPYVAKRDGKVVGTAYFDAHKVRTLREVLMIVVTPERTVARVELLAFGEPTEYVPRPNWYAQFNGKVEGDKLRIRRGIRNMTGATLTARATAACVRRTLALHALLAERAEGKVAAASKVVRASASKPVSRPASRPTRRTLR